MSPTRSTEAITMVQALISQSADIQKVLAFEGAFEKLFNIVTQEGGVDGGAVASGALTCVDGLLRFNTSNQVRVLVSCMRFCFLNILYQVLIVRLMMNLSI